MRTFKDHLEQECDLEFRNETVDIGQTVRSFWCNTHHQWTYEFPTKIVLELTWTDEYDITTHTLRGAQ